MDNIQLIGVDCPKCGYHFYTYAKTHTTKCDKCNTKFDIIEIEGENNE